MDAIAMVIRKENFKLFSARVKSPMSRQYSWRINIWNWLLTGCDTNEMLDANWYIEFVDKNRNTPVILNGQKWNKYDFPIFVF